MSAMDFIRNAGEINNPELPSTCCKNIGGEHVEACGRPAKHWYVHGFDVCSYCDEHNYQCGAAVGP